MVDTPDLQRLSSQTLEGALGLEITEIGEERARGHFEVTDAVRQPFGVVHGGAYAAMAETLASAATYLAVQADGKVAVGQSNHTSFVRPVTRGSVHAEGRRRHRGRTSWIWEVDFTDDEGRLCALSRVTIAVRVGTARGRRASEPREAPSSAQTGARQDGATPGSRSGW